MPFPPLPRQPLGAAHTYLRERTNYLVTKKERFYFAWRRTRAFASTSDWPVSMSTSAMWLARWATLVFVCNTLFSQRVTRWDAKVWVKHDLPDVLVWMEFLVVSIHTWYTRALHGINSLWITVSFCSSPQLHMVFVGPGEELAVVALWIKVQPVYFSGYFSLFPSNNKYVNKSRRSFAFL